ncbi:MAG: hypothetical protein ACYCSO_10165 [Cuniculiplasma sp.]
MKSQITLHTRLNSGIYKSHGGGQDVTVSNWNCGPANLLKALDSLYEERQSNIRGYGNIGCGSSWLEIDGEYFERPRLMMKFSSSNIFATIRISTALLSAEFKSLNIYEQISISDAPCRHDAAHRNGLSA